MKTGITELVLVIGKSRSEKYAEECAAGFESMFFRKKMNVLEGEVVLTTILFDDSAQIFHDRVDIHAAKPLTKADLTGKGSSAWTTALCAAIGKTNTVLQHTSEEFRPDKVLYVIISDGILRANQVELTALKNKITQSRNNGSKYLICSYDVDAFAQFGNFASDIGLDYENVIGTFRKGYEKEFFVGLLGDISRIISSKTNDEICMYTTGWWQELYTNRSNIFSEGVIK